MSVIKESRGTMFWLGGVAVWLAVSAGPGHCVVAELPQIVGDSEIVVRRGAPPDERRFRFLPKEQERPKVEADTALLRNGDRLSGVIESITDGCLLVRPELLPRRGGVRVPMENVRKILFKDKQGSAFEGEARAIFVSGDSLSISVKEYDGEELLAQAIFSDDVRIRKEHLAGIVFRHEPRVIYRADFGHGPWSAFKPHGAIWVVSDGDYDRPGLSSWAKAAYVKLRQEGHVRYTWEASTERGFPTQVQFFIFAQCPDHHSPGNAYFVRALGSRVYLYRTIQNNAQYVGSANLSSNKSFSKFEVDYDSRSGTMRLKVDGEQVIAGVFSSPIVRGEYIIVTGESQVRLDNVVVWQIWHGAFPPAAEQEVKDFVWFLNEDRVSGKIVLISERKVRIETGYSSEPIDVPVEEVSSLRFAGTPASQKEKLPTISFRNGDRLSGEVIGLVENSLRVCHPCLGHIEIDVNDVDSVIFGEIEKPIPLTG